MRPKILPLLSFLHSMRKQPFLWMEIIKEFYLAKRKKRTPYGKYDKIMTCLYAIEHGNLSDKVTFSRRAASAPKVRLGARSGSQFLLSDLLYALMLNHTTMSLLRLRNILEAPSNNFVRI